MTMAVIAIAVTGFAGGMCLVSDYRSVRWLGLLNLAACGINIGIALQ